MRCSRRALLGLLAVAPCGCVVRAPEERFEAVPSRAAARRQLTELAYEHRRLWLRYSALEAGDAPEAARAAAHQEVARVLFEAERLLEYHEALLTPRRRLLWQLGALGARLESDAETRALTEAIRERSQAVLDGEPLTTAQLTELVTSPDAKLRDAAWQSRLTRHEAVAPLTTRLLLRRRVAARELGEDTFRALMRLRHLPGERTRGLTQRFVRGTERELQALVHRMRVAARPPRLAAEHADWLLERATSSPAPWFPAERLPPFVQGVARDLELPLAAVPQAPSVAGRAGYEAALRELSAAALRDSVSETDPLLQGYPGALGLSEPAFDAGVAFAFTALLADSQVLKERLGLSPRDAERAAANARARALFEARRHVAWAAFEERALQNPQQDLVRTAAGLHRRLTGVDGMLLWTEHPRLLRAPLVSQCEALGALVGTQILEVLAVGANPQKNRPASHPGKTGAKQSQDATPGARGATSGRAAQGLASGSLTYAASTASGDGRSASALLRDHIFSVGMSQGGDEKLVKLTGRRLGVEAMLGWVRPRRPPPFRRPMTLD
ncbi:MAG: hypothetical protein KIT72_16235 [Polyangiaceae bacterium]|nr:hypothetical protein [Polyangiaceae bacterium]MCW5791967.1 hypothetical protein [Polyangiaceae bacterium]